MSQNRSDEPAVEPWRAGPRLPVMELALHVGGIPLHPLLVHAVVVLTPLTAAAVLQTQFWPVARRRLGIVTPLAALAVLTLVPVTVRAGRELATRIGAPPAVLTHQHYGEMLLPLLGFIFLPLTTLVYAWELNNHMATAGINLLWLLIAVLIDLGGLGGGASRRRS